MAANGANVDAADSVCGKRGRLLLLSTNMGLGGGAEEQVLQLAYGFHARGWQTRIVSLLVPSPMPADFAGRGIPLDHLGMKRGVANPISIHKLSRIIREFRPDVVHSHMNHANLLARAARLFQPFPALVGTLHALTMAGVEKDRTRIFEIAHRLTDRWSECTTAICHAAADYYVRRGAVPAEKMRVVPNGINITRFRPTPGVRERMRRELGVEDRFVWLAAGRLELAKAYPTMIRAFARLSEGNHTLLICGQGSLGESLRALVNELGIASRVRFMGLRSDIPEVMAAADAFALSSDSEGLPLVLLQAAAAGLPIVSTNVGGNGEAVVDGLNGRLVPAGNPEAFAAAMIQMQALPAADRAALGAAGQKRVRDMFEVDHVLDTWERLYAELLAGKLDSDGCCRVGRDVATREDDQEQLMAAVR